MTTRIRSKESARVDIVRKRLTRGIRFAIGESYKVADGSWFEDGSVCPVAARILHVNNGESDVLAELQEKQDNYTQKQWSNKDTTKGYFSAAAKLAGLTTVEVYFFTNGFDGYDIDEADDFKHTELAKRMHTLGQQFRAQYV